MKCGWVWLLENPNYEDVMKGREMKILVKR